VRGNVEKLEMDTYETCNCFEVHIKETEEQRKGRVLVERAAIIVV